jgi:hypothetical protein
LQREHAQVSSSESVTSAPDNLNHAQTGISVVAPIAAQFTFFVLDAIPGYQDYFSADGFATNESIYEISFEEMATGCDRFERLGHGGRPGMRR